MVVEILKKISCFILMIVFAVLTVAGFIIAVIDGAMAGLCVLPFFINVGGAFLFAQWDFFWLCIKFAGSLCGIFLVSIFIAAMSQFLVCRCFEVVTDQI